MKEIAEWSSSLFHRAEHSDLAVVVIENSYLV